jgi:hypothetical protein
LQPHSTQEQPDDRASYQPVASAHDRRHGDGQVRSENPTRLRAKANDPATFLGRSPGTAEAEDVRRFRLHLTASGAGAPKINATVAALRFFFKVTLDRPDLVKAD